MKPDWLGFFSGLLVGLMAAMLTTIPFKENSLLLASFLTDVSGGIAFPLSLVFSAAFISLAMLRSKRISLRDFLAFVSFGFMLALFLALLANVSVFRSDSCDGAVYSSWLFHECMVEHGSNARLCSDSVINHSTGYNYYPPFSHILASLITLQGVMFLSVFGIWLALLLGSNSFVAPIITFFSAPTIWFWFMRGGTIPFFLFLFLVVIAYFVWNSIGWVKKTALVVAALLTHTYGGYFFVVYAILLEFLPEKIRDIALLFFVLLTSVFVIVVLDTWRGLLLALVFIGTQIEKRKA